MPKFRNQRKLILRYTIIFLALFLWYELIDISDLKYENQIIPKKLPKLVCALYSGNYANEAHDGYFSVWNKSSGWSYKDSQKKAPFDISTFLFPQLGVYSSHDESIIRTHFKMMRESGIDAVVLLWEGHNHSNTTFTDITLDIMFDIAKEFNLKIGILIQSYNLRTNITIYEDIVYYIDKYKNREEILKIDEKPVVIIYDSFNVRFLYKTIEKCRLSQIYDCFFISNIVSNDQIGRLCEDDFDAVFTYFASESFKQPSTIEQWPHLQQICDERGIGLTVAVSPGYHEKGNHWTQKMNRKREDGRYYDNMWNAAINSHIRIVIINSFNNWIEATNIEPALDRNGYEFNLDSWHSTNKNPNFYLEKTLEWTNKFHGFSR